MPIPKEGIIYEIIEGVQRGVTKLLPTLKDKLHEDRQMKLYLPKLRYRRSRRGMIETFGNNEVSIYDKETYEHTFKVKIDSVTMATN